MATVIKKPQNTRKPWTCRYSADGKQQERSFATRRQADDFRIKTEHDIREQTFVDPAKSREAFDAAAATWIAALDRAPNTRRTYLSVLNAQIAPAFEGKTLAQVASNRMAVEIFLAEMSASASRKSSALSVIMGTCNHAVQSRRLARHDLAGLTVRQDAIKQATITPLSKDQLEALASGLPAELALTIWLMRGAGLRISEALAVRLDNFRNGTLRISEQIARDASLAPLKGRRPNEYRDVPVPVWLKAKVAEHVAKHGTDDGYLFGKDGKRVSYGSYKSRFDTAAKLANLPSLNPHMLRHLFASTLLSAGVPLTDVSTWLGHKDVRVTSAVYSHLLPDSWTRGRDALEHALDG